jgi:hypothetical protein
MAVAVFSAVKRLKEIISMRFQRDSRFSLTRRKTAAVLVVLGVHLELASPASAALESGVFQTLPDANAEERGDYVPGGKRNVPFSATLTFDLAATQPLLTAVIHNAVLEGGSVFGDAVLGGGQQPFELVVRSSSGLGLVDGSYRFTGDYMQEIYPSGTQYLFDWRFSTASDGSIVWNGNTFWAGGHIWLETISGITIQPSPVPEPSGLVLLGIGLGILSAFRVTQKTR